MKQALIGVESETDNFTIIVGDFNTPLSIMARTARQKINMEKEDLNNTISPKPKKHVQDTIPNNSSVHILLIAHGTFSKADHMLNSQ